MSFDATRLFPWENLNLSGQDFIDVPGEGPFWLARSHSSVASFLGARLHGVFSSIPGTPSDIDLVQWAVKVINNHASALGYQVRIRSPGGRIPREDMLPILTIFSLGMSGVTPFSPSGQNDGVVDTASMRGPVNNPIQDIANPNWTAALDRRFLYINQMYDWQKWSTDLDFWECVDQLLWSGRLITCIVISQATACRSSTSDSHASTICYVL
ncbi:hypothetical protein B0J14DRAFT_567098 [Halenospora varia]|nr:hypothetical protein B0J14DRAFT_567098 [Halenospora varia]